MLKIASGCTVNDKSLVETLIRVVSQIRSSVITDREIDQNRLRGHLRKMSFPMLFSVISSTHSSILQLIIEKSAQCAIRPFHHGYDATEPSRAREAEASRPQEALQTGVFRSTAISQFLAHTRSLLLDQHNITAYSKLNKKDLIDKVASALSLITPSTSAVSTTTNAQPAISPATTSSNASVVREDSIQSPRTETLPKSAAKDAAPPSNISHAASADTPARTEDRSSGARQSRSSDTSAREDRTSQSNRSKITASTASGLAENPSITGIQSQTASRLPPSRSASRIATIASLANDTSTAHSTPSQSQTVSNNASTSVAQLNPNDLLSAPTHKLPVKGRPNRQLIEMTEENFAELERLKRQKISAKVRVRANNVSSEIENWDKRLYRPY